jgi:cysteine desulfurase
VTERPRIYLDHAATTPILPAARAAMAEALGRWANPSSPHAEGRAARAALEEARERIKRALCWDRELIFTSGATEAIDIVLRSFPAQEIAVSAVEHDAVFRAAPSAWVLPVGVDGRVDPTALPSCRLLVVQAANNETGILQPTRDVAEAAASRGTVFFSDCAQSAGKTNALPPADLICVASHKLGGPPGTGALLVRDLRLLKARGGQERGYRGGTQNLPAILGFAAALEAREDWLDRAQELRDRLEERLASAGAEIVGAGLPRIATIGAYRMPGVPAEAQLIHFDLGGIAVSAGSACSSGTMKVSHVLKAMGWDEQAAREVVRVSFGPQTTEQEVDRFCAAWEQLAERKRAA